jgi:hypothetical protein
VVEEQPSAEEEALDRPSVEAWEAWHPLEPLCLELEARVVPVGEEQERLEGRILVEPAVLGVPVEPAAPVERREEERRALPCAAEPVEPEVLVVRRVLVVVDS